MLPLEAPSRAHLLGADGLGRDALSRYLDGGRVLVAVAFVATILAYVDRHPARHGDRLSTRRCSTSRRSRSPISFWPFRRSSSCWSWLPPLGPSLSVVIFGIAIINLPRVVRIARTVTIDLVTREFVEASIARGESLFSILRSDILPNIWTPILADFGIRLTGSIILFSSLSYLGFGQQPPAADWGLMISENRVGMFLQPWVIVVPAMTIALLCIGVNLIADGSRAAPAIRSWDAMSDRRTQCSVSIDSGWRRRDGADIVDEVAFDVAAARSWRLSASPAAARRAPRSHCWAMRRPGTRIAAGSVRLDGSDLLLLDPAARRRARAADLLCAAGSRCEPQSPSSGRRTDQRGTDRARQSSRGSSPIRRRTRRRVGLADAALFRAAILSS